MNILETRRLFLRRASRDDFELLYKLIFSNKDVVKHTFGASLFTYEQTIEFLEKNLNFSSDIGLSVLVEKNSLNIVGLAGVLKCEYLDKIDYEIGFILAKKYWGIGYAQEIGKAQIDFVRDRLKATRALALVSLANKASINSIKKLDLKYLKTVDTTRGKREVYKIDFD